MAATIKQTEAIPENYPTKTVGEIYDDQSNAAWQRIESYIAHRWTPRAVTWIVEGAGEWEAPLTPATINSVEFWNGGAWENCTAPDSPLGGYWLASNGPYRFTATVGGGEVPEVVYEAFCRLARYMSAISRTPIKQTATRKIELNPSETSRPTQTLEQFRIREPDINGSTEFAANWTAKALTLSGAADLLRPYRRA